MAKSFILHVLYHPPASSKTSGSVTEFYNEIELLLSLSTLATALVGDFNVHMDVSHKAMPLCELLETFNLVQLVKEPTHIAGHIWT